MSREIEFIFNVSVLLIGALCTILATRSKEDDKQRKPTVPKG